MTLKEKNDMMINDELQARARQAAKIAATNIKNDPSNLTDLKSLFIEKIENHLFGDWVFDYTQEVVSHSEFTTPIEDAQLQSLVDSRFVETAKKYYHKR